MCSSFLLVSIFYLRERLTTSYLERYVDKRQFQDDSIEEASSSFADILPKWGPGK